MREAMSYQEWYRAAQELDWLEGLEIWKLDKRSDIYDWRLIESRLEHLRGLAADGDESAAAAAAAANSDSNCDDDDDNDDNDDANGSNDAAAENAEALVALMRAGLLRNLGGLGNRELHCVMRTGTKRLVEEYVVEVCRQLRRVCKCKSMSLQQRFDFFYETRQAFGRSALMLSGGASMGMYHVGVVKALADRHLLPRIISGASAGSLVAAIVGVLRNDELPVIWEEGALQLDAFDRRGPGSFGRRARRLIHESVLMDVRLLEQCVRDNIGDITFKEAYERTGRITNIIVASTEQYEQSRLLNYLTAPDVLIWSAACASCALKYLYKPVELMAKDMRGQIRVYHPSGLKWSDGSVPNDLPMRRISELFNVNHFIVSQVNPHVVPFLPNLDRKQSLVERLVRSEFVHRLRQLAMCFPSLRIFSAVIQQTYVGHITIVPNLSLNDYMHVVTNPTVKSFQRSIAVGQRSTWPHISYTQNHCQVELVLEHCTQLLRQQLYKQP
jgi:predicted acylesterase/phospholipase RssA